VSSPPDLAGSFDKADESVAEALRSETISAPQQGRWPAFLQGTLQSRDFIITVVAIALFIFFSVGTERFLTADNLLNILRNLSFVGIVAVGMTYLFIAGELDLSVGSVFGFLTVLMGFLVARHGFDPWVGMVLVIAVGLAIGALNGLITTGLNIPSFIVTLGGLTAFRSLALILSGQNPSTTEGVGLFYDVTGGYIGGVFPWLVVWMAAVMLIGGAILASTRFAYHAYATGGNRDAARRSGIDINRVKIVCFMLTSGLCGLVAALIWGYLHVAAPITGTGLEFRVIGAVIIGGVALTGGRGTIYGTLLGAIIVGIITNGLVLLGFSQYFGDVATGLLIVSVGTLDLIVQGGAARGIRFLHR
jgi:ribose transport system permease protein